MQIEREQFSLGYSPEFDALRGYAILLVTAFHAAPKDGWLIGGYLGVDLFFVLSGFLITALLFKEIQTNGRINYKKFYIRRALRLAPALSLMLFVFVLLSVLFLERAQFVKNIEGSIYAFFYIANWTRAFGMWQPDWVGHTWSLAIEEQFYIAWPLIILACSKLRLPAEKLLALCFGLALTACAWRAYLTLQDAHWMRVYNGLDTRADSLLLGATLGMGVYYPHFRTMLYVLRPAITVAASLGIILLGIFTYKIPYESKQLYLYVFTLVEIITCIFILDVLLPGRTPLKFFLRLKPVIWLGTVSYGFYLWHYPIFRVMRHFECSVGQILVWGTAMALVATTLSYYLLEKPILRLKDKFH